MARVIFAAAAIDCTGRAALSSGAAAERRRLDRMVAAWRVLDLPDDAETAAATLVEAVELGWWYMSPIPGRRMMLGLFTDSDLLPSGVAQDGARWAGLAAGTHGDRAAARQPRPRRGCGRCGRRRSRRRPRSPSRD